MRWRAIWPSAKLLLAQTQRSDSFGRYQTELYAAGVNVSDRLVQHGLAAYQVYR